MFSLTMAGSVKPERSGIFPLLKPDRKELVARAMPVLFHHFMHR